MQQPPGFVHPQFPHHVCRLRRSIYGLKHATRAWYHRFSTFLQSIGFTCTNSDTSMFVFLYDKHILILLLYVNDIILTGSSPKLISHLISKLSFEFSMKDLGDLHYFLGVQAVRTSSTLFLSQHKYPLDLIRKFHLHTLKPVRTPLVSRTTLSLSDCELLTDPTEYRSMVGALQYLTLT